MVSTTCDPWRHAFPPLMLTTLDEGACGDDECPGKGHGSNMNRAEAIETISVLRHKAQHIISNIESARGGWWEGKKESIAMELALDAAATANREMLKVRDWCDAHQGNVPDEMVATVQRHYEALEAASKRLMSGMTLDGPEIDE